MKKKVVILALVFVMMVTLLSACVPPEKAIIGTWKTQNTVLGVVTETTYVFEEDGTGSQKTVLEVPFTYTVEENKLTITTTILEVELDEEYTFEIEGDKLLLTKGSETTTFEKVK